MQTESYHSQRTPAEWSGAQLLMEKWLASQCAKESFVHFLSGAVNLAFGIVALILTSFVFAAAAGAVLGEANLMLSLYGSSASLLRPFLFGLFFVLFLALSVAHAYKTRWDSEGVPKIIFGNPLSTAGSLAWEFLSAGPILMILSLQDFQRYARLSRLDVRQVGAVLLWLYDKGGKASFAEISLAFPKLNAVRVLPQLRDLPGINWWPDEGEISLSENIRKTFAEILHREAKTSSAFNDHARERQDFKRPIVQVDQEILSWYAALNLPIFVPLQQVKARYRKLAKMYHPDMRAAASADGQVLDDERMKSINAAYHNILKHAQEHAGNPQ